jgi:hypothetical protein
MERSRLSLQAWEVRVRVGKGLKGSGGLSAGQDLMKGAAMVYTEVGSRPCARSVSGGMIGVKHEDAYGSVGVGCGDFADRVALQRGVQGFGYEDRTGDGQVVFAGHQRGGAEVGRSSDALDYGREGDEAARVGVGEGVLAGLNRGDAGGGQGAGEQLDMLFLVMRDVLEVLVVLGREAWGIVRMR